MVSPPGLLWGMAMNDADVPETAGRMAAATAAFLAALTGSQREKACFPFGDERRDWSFVPSLDRTGLPIGALDEGQRGLAHELIVTGTSLPGYAKVVSVMAMEHVLRVLRSEAAGLFDPERYCFKVFGQPDELIWGWQFAGHHVSLNYTIADGRFIAPTPCLLGAEPLATGRWIRWRRRGTRLRVRTLTGPGAAARRDHSPPLAARLRHPDGAEDRRHRTARPGVRSRARLPAQRGRT